MATTDWDKVLIDTSAWIDFFRKKEPIYDTVLGIIDTCHVCCAGIIIAELIQGAKSLREVEIIKEFIHVFDFLKETPAIWESAGKLSFLLRSKGKPVGLADCYIASLAKSHDAALLTLDSHFQTIKSHEKINLVRIKN